MWNYRSKIYLQIALTQADIDPDAIFEATKAHLACLQTDKKGRIVVRKWTREEDVRTGLLQCAQKLFNMGASSYESKNYEQALTYYKTILDILPYDTENLASIKITRGNIYMNSFYSA